ncbi:MAG TPA: D-alanyl-lipoteichoic acid biosynthesis protein DltD, partial [Bacillota bacterium]|nr:D-alanyl-lipoteichoic acid biosynthesis protein DltD [Bacillota bacterium]
MAQGRRPVGILAALIAAVIAVIGLMAVQAYALRLAESDLAQTAAAPLPIKFETLTFQRAALATSGELPIYGSSELFCCGQPDLPTQFFAHAPTGFQPFAVGRAGTGDLMFLESFGALGHAVQGKRLVLSVSPQWYYGSAGITAGYDGNFSPEVAEVFTYDAPLPLPLREAAAKQMAAHPATLKGQGLLRLGVQALAAGNLVAYDALIPAGRLDAWAQEVKDAWQTIQFVGGGNRAPGPVQRVVASGQSSPAATRSAGAQSVAAAGPSSAGQAAAGPATTDPAVGGSSSTAQAVAGSASTGQAAAAVHAAGVSAAAVPSPAAQARLLTRPAPAPSVALQAPAAASAPASAPAKASAAPSLSSPPDPALAVWTRLAAGPAAPGPIDWTAKLRAASSVENTLAGRDPFGFYLSAASLRDIAPALRLYCSGARNPSPYPAKWVSTMTSSAEWTDLSLELQALRDLGAQALVWTVPFQGYYDNYTQLVQPARAAYYRRFLQVAGPSGFAAVDFAQLDQDRLAMANMGAHFSA